MQEAPETIVVGFGPVGSSILHHLSHAGHSVLGVPSRCQEPIDGIPTVVRVGEAGSSSEGRIRKLAVRTHEIIGGFAERTGVSILRETGKTAVLTVEPKRYCAVQRALALVDGASLLGVHAEGFRGTDSHAWLTTADEVEHRARYLIICANKRRGETRPGVKLYAWHRFLLECRAAVELNLPSSSTCGVSAVDIHPIGPKIGHVRKYVIECKTPSSPADAVGDQYETRRSWIWEEIQSELLQEAEARLLGSSTRMLQDSADEGFRIDRHPEASRIIFVDDPGRFGSLYGPAIGEAIAKAVLDGCDPTTALETGRYA